MDEFSDDSVGHRPAVQRQVNSTIIPIAVPVLLFAYLQNEFYTMFTSSKTSCYLVVVTIFVTSILCDVRVDTPLFSLLICFDSLFSPRVAYRSDRVTSSFRLCSFTDRTQGVSLWLPFQTAAGTVTSLYKGACTSLVSLVNNVSKINLHSVFLSRDLSFFLYDIIFFVSAFLFSFFIYSFTIRSSFCTAVIHTRTYIHIHTN